MEIIINGTEEIMMTDAYGNVTILKKENKRKEKGE